MIFDPSAPEASRWRTWLDAAPGDRGVPTDAMLEIQTAPADVRLLRALG